MGSRNLKRRRRLWNNEGKPPFGIFLRDSPRLQGRAAKTGQACLRCLGRPAGAFFGCIFQKDIGYSERVIVKCGNGPLGAVFLCASFLGGCV